MDPVTMHITQVLQLLEQVQKGTISAIDALQQWPDPEAQEDKQVKQAWHNLWHFAYDEDIRRKDSRYAVFQHEVLQEDIQRLREKLAKHWTS